MFSNKPLKRIMITLGLSVLLVFGFYYALFLDIKKKSENIAVMTKDLSSREEQEKYAISTKNKIESISSDIANINNSIIPANGDVQFIEDFELLANSNNLDLEIESLLFEDQPRATVAGTTFFKIRAKTKGTWVNTYRFLDQLESLPFKVKISQFAFLGQEVPVGTNKKRVEWQSLFEIHILKYK